jgi:hypothetical protein
MLTTLFAAQSITAFLLIVERCGLTFKRKTARVLRYLCIFEANRIIAVVAFAPDVRGRGRIWSVFVNRQVAEFLQYVV